MKILSKENMTRIEGRLKRIYGDMPEVNVSQLMERLAMLVGRYGVGLNPQPCESLYSENDVVLITYADSVFGEEDKKPIATLRRFCDKYLRHNISCIHILPFSPWSSDDGFSVIDYREVNPDYGRWENIEALAFEHSLMFDLVLNHCSRKSEWFKDFVAGVAPASNYFITEDPNTDLSNVVRPRPWPLLTEVATRDGIEHVWTTFSEDQIDLNWKDPNVLFEFLDILFLYISKGMRIVRLDAIAFLWKEIGTNCLHLPETHEFVKLFRDVLEMVAPNVVLLTETNVPHEENISYFGEGDEAHMVYNFSLPPLLLHALLSGKTSYLINWAKSLDELPDGCTFFNFTASHDGVGVRPLQGIVEDHELNWLMERVRERGAKVNMRRMPDGSEKPYELNVTYVSALSEPEDELLGEDRFICSQAIQLGFRGIPAVYIHSLLGTRNYVEGVEQTGENRTINRRKWNIHELEGLIEDEATSHGRIYKRYLSMLRRRKNHKAFHPDAPMTVMDTDSRLFAFMRVANDGSERIVCVHSMSRETVKIPLVSLDISLGVKDKSVRDIFNSQTLKTGPKRQLTLKPYGSVWIILKED